MKIEVSVGEIVDKLSILKIKTDFIKDEEKLNNVKKEYDYLLAFAPGRRVCQNTMMIGDDIFGPFTDKKPSLMEDHLKRMQEDSFEMSTKLFREKQQQSWHGIMKEKFGCNPNAPEHVYDPNYKSPWRDFAERFVDQVNDDVEKMYVKKED